MVRTKELAEFQFDATAAPISLGIKFENFCAFSLKDQILDNDVDDLVGYDLYDDKIDDLPIEPVHLALVANDLDPEKRDLECERVQSLEKDEEFEELKFELDQKNFQISSEKIDSIDFKIKHSEIKQSLSDFRPENKIVTAFRLVSLAIDKLSDDDIQRFDLKNVREDKEYFSNLALIDKSMESIKFINQLGIRVMNQFLTQFPDRFKEFPSDTEAQINWFNTKIRPGNQLDFIFSCAYLSSRLKFSNIEINDNPGFNLKIKPYCRLKCHTILRIMHLHTVHLNQNRFANFEKFIKKFSLVFGGSRLFYLEKLIFDAKQNLIFFDSHEQNFSEVNGKFKNDSFPFHDFDLLAKLSTKE